MAKSRRKSGGATRGRFKPKKLGKGWSTMRAGRGPRSGRRNKGSR